MSSKLQVGTARLSITPTPPEGAYLTGFIYREEPSKGVHDDIYATAVVFKTEPLNYVGSGKPINKKSPLKDFDLSGDLKNLPQSEIDKLEPIIQKYADQAIVNALDEANLISN